VIAIAPPATVRRRASNAAGLAVPSDAEGEPAPEAGESPAGGGGNGRVPAEEGTDAATGSPPVDSTEEPGGPIGALALAAPPLSRSLSPDARACDLVFFVLGVVDCSLYPWDTWPY